MSQGDICRKVGMIVYFIAAGSAAWVFYMGYILFFERPFELNILSAIVLVGFTATVGMYLNMWRNIFRKRK